ncbi:MAG: sigma-70 family RNA polymerase sigma factor [Nannocystaceae bacterium]
MTRDDVHRALGGDRQALTALLRELMPVIKVEVGVALVRRALPRRRDPRQDVEDFSQEVLLHLLADGGKVLRMWDPARGRSLPSFVRLITRHRISRILHGHRGNPWSDEPTELGDFDDLMPEASRDDRVLETREELRALLERLRGHLSERGVLLFQMIYAEQRPINAVCEAMGMTRGAVDAWMSRTRKLARQLAAPPAEESRP